MESTRRRQSEHAVDSESSEREATSALTLGDVEAVLRRAVQLDARQRVPEGSALTVEDLTRIAIEAGISPDALQKALQELALGHLGREEQQGLIDKLFGPRTIAVARVAEMPPELTKSELHRILREELLELVERRGGKVIWEPERGALASVMRTIRKVFAGRQDLRGMEIASEVRSADSSGQRALVSLEAQLKDRSGYTVPPLVVGSLAGLGALILAAVGLGELSEHAARAGQLLIASSTTVGIGAVTTAGLGALLARAWRERVRRARLSLEHLLDNLTGDGS
jgi:hypothetical protein